jgi:hypothetical protein
MAAEKGKRGRGDGLFILITRFIHMVDPKHWNLAVPGRTTPKRVRD